MERDPVKEPTWTSELRDGHELIARVGRQGAKVVAEFPNTGTLWASRDGAESEFIARSGADPAVVKKLEASLVQALLRHLRGQWTLHGSAVAADGKAIGFLGDAAAGKSTLVAALCSTARYELVADDTLLIDAGAALAVRIHPSQQVIWLLRDPLADPTAHDAAFRKCPVNPAAVCPAMTEVAVLAVLKFDDLTACGARRLHGAEAFGVLAKSLIRFVVDEPDLQLQEFEELARLQRTCLIVELVRPRDLRQIPQTISVIEDLLRNGCDE